MSVDTHEPRDPSEYASFVQDGLLIYYSPKLDRQSDTLELDYVRIFFRNKLIIAGPENLLASIIMGRI